MSIVLDDATVAVVDPGPQGRVLLEEDAELDDHPLVEVGHVVVQGPQLGKEVVPVRLEPPAGGDDLLGQPDRLVRRLAHEAVLGLELDHVAADGEAGEVEREVVPARPLAAVQAQVERCLTPVVLCSRKEKKNQIINNHFYSLPTYTRQSKDSKLSKIFLSFLCVFFFFFFFCSFGSRNS